MREKETHTMVTTAAMEGIRKQYKYINCHTVSCVSGQIYGRREKKRVMSQETTDLLSSRYIYVMYTHM